MKKSTKKVLFLSLLGVGGYLLYKRMNPSAADVAKKNLQAIVANMPPVLRSQVQQQGAKILDAQKG